MNQKTFSKILVDNYDPTLPTVIFDLDDTLGDMHIHLIEHANETYGLSETSERWQAEFSFVKLAEKCGVDTDTFYEVLKNDLRPVQKFKVNELAPKFINLVREQFELETKSKVNVHVVTSRGNFWLDHSDLILETVKSLPIEGVHVIDVSTCKATWSAEKFNVIAMFEDSPRHIEACAKMRIPVFISSLDYNRHFNIARFSLRENDFGCFS
jgi:hypothetical protein